MLTAIADLQVTPAKNTPCTTQLKQRATSVNGTGLRGRVMASRSQQAPLSKRPIRMKATLPDFSESSTLEASSHSSSLPLKGEVLQLPEIRKLRRAPAYLHQLRDNPSDAAGGRWDPRAPRALHGSPDSNRFPATFPLLKLPNRERADSEGQEYSGGF